MKRKIKGYIISAILILGLVVSIFITYKKGYLDDIVRKEIKNVSVNSNTKDTTIESQDINKNEITLLNKGESYSLEYDSKKITGKYIPQSDYLYNVEYVDSYATRELPPGMSINYYLQEEKKKINSDNSFYEGYYYVIVEVNMTNLRDTTEIVTPHNVRIGNFVNDNYKNIGEPRDFISDGKSDKGVLEISYEQKKNIKLCYIVPDEYMDENLVVKYEICSQNKYEGEVPYLIINKE